MDKNRYSRRLLLLILVSAILRLITSAVVELGNDEVYYWTYAQRLSWNYFDHPPMVAIWIRLFTANLFFENLELFIRLGSVFSCVAATVILFDTVKRMHSEKAAWYAAVLYNASLYGGIITGIFILPDSPQMLFWTCALWTLVRIEENPSRLLWWIIFGLATGLCIMSKIHGAFLWFGFGCYIIFCKRAYFKFPQLYFAFFITAVISSPIVFWNIANDFITYRFHSERVAVNQFALNWTGFIREISGEFFYNNPFNVIITAAGLLAFRKLKKVSDPALIIYNWIALPMIAILVTISLFRNTLPHWSGPAYITLIPLASIYLAEKISSRLQNWSLGFAGFIVIVGICLINFFPGTMGKKLIENLGAGDFTLDMYGWRKAGIDFARIRNEEISKGNMKKENPVVAHKWFTAAHEDFYFCRPAGIELIGLGEMHELHHYVWMNQWRIAKADMQNAWCVVPSNETYDVKLKFSPFYQRADSIGIIVSKRMNKPARSFIVYKLSGWKGDRTNLVSR